MRLFSFARNRPYWQSVARAPVVDILFENNRGEAIADAVDGFSKCPRDMLGTPFLFLGIVKTLVQCGVKHPGGDCVGRKGEPFGIVKRGNYVKGTLKQHSEGAKESRLRSEGLA